MVKTHGCYYLTKFRSKHNTHNSSHLYNQVLGISTQVSTDPNIEAGARNTSKWDFWAHSASLPIRCNTKRHRKNPRLGRNQPKAIPTKTLKKSKTWSDTTKGNSSQDLAKLKAIPLSKSLGLKGWMLMIKLQVVKYTNKSIEQRLNLSKS